MDSVITHIHRSSFDELVTFYHHDYDEGKKEGRLIPLLDLYRSLQSSRFMDILITFINEYVIHLSIGSDDNIQDDWITKMIDEYDYDIFRYSQEREPELMISTIMLIDFMLIFMELLYESGIVEIYRSHVNTLKVSRHGKINISFG